jgi:hypothetical protein
MYTGLLVLTYDLLHRFGANFYFSNKSLISLRNAYCLNNDKQFYLTNFTLQNLN